MRRWRQLPFRRGQFTWVPPAAQQPQPPAFVPQVIRQAGRRVVRPARGRFTTVPQPPGLPPAGITRRRPQAVLPRRGRFAEPAWPPQAPPPPPTFTVGALSASAAATATQAPTDAAVSALSAAVAPQGTLTAGTQRTGGPS